MKRVSLSAILLSMGIMLVGCGGGSDTASVEVDTSYVEGQFIDAPVAGLDYSCSSGDVGVTDIMGTFRCKNGDEISFQLNGFDIGRSAIGRIVTPADLHPNDPQKVADVARLLQTMDNDNNPENGIVLDKTSQKMQAIQNMEATLGTVDFNEVVKSYTGLDLVPEVTAMEHLNKNVKNYTNTTQTNANTGTIVGLNRNVSKEYCASFYGKEVAPVGYSSFTQFIDAGGSQKIEWKAGNLTCTSFGGADFCDDSIVETNPANTGNGTCALTLNIPNFTMPSIPEDMGVPSNSVNDGNFIYQEDIITIGAPSGDIVTPLTPLR